MNHAELVERAVRWLLNTHGCTFAFSEFSASGREIPDAIGFQQRWSTVIECKVSRADFAADRKKPYRRVPSLGMGLQRYFLVPAELIHVGDLPPKWGLLWAYGRHIKVVRKSEGFADRSYPNEIAFLVSMLRRAEIRAIAAHYAAGNQTRSADFLNQWLRDEHRHTGTLEVVNG